MGGWHGAGGDARPQNDADRHDADRHDADRHDGDENSGAAVIDFVLMSVLLVFLLFAVLQVAVFFYARNVAAASAADAARYASAEGVDPHDGVARAESLLRQGLDDRDARAIRCTSVAGRDAASGLPVTTVHCSGRIRLFFSPLGLPLTVDVQSSVLREQTPA